MASDIIICLDVKTERLLKIGTNNLSDLNCLSLSQLSVKKDSLFCEKPAITFKKQNPNISELLETQLNIHGAWYGKSGPDMVGRGLAGAGYGGCNMVWNVPTLVEVTPFIERSEGWSLRSVGVLDQSQQECRFFRRNSNPLQIFQLRPKRETSSSSLGDRLEKRSIISPLNRAICAGLRGTSGFRPVPVTTVAPTN